MSLWATIRFCSKSATLVACLMTIVLFPIVKGEADQHVVVKENSKDTSLKYEDFSFEQDEDLVRIFPNVKTGAGEPPSQAMNVGVELGFKPQKVRIAFGPEQKMQMQQSQQHVQRHNQPQSKRQRPQPQKQKQVANPAVVSNRYQWGQSGNARSGGGSGFGKMDEKNMKSIFDEVAEAILQAADALYFSMNPAEAQASGLVWGGGAGQRQHNYAVDGAGLSNGNPTSQSRKSRWILVTIILAMMM